MPPEPHPRSPMFVADAAALGALVDRLRGEPIIALDTESNSFHVYRERVCLLQVSTRTGDFVVDPLAVDPAPLGEILCDGRETVLHGADYDVRCLRREYGWRLPRLFDTMAAARRLGRTGLGLSALVEGQFGVRLSKSFQRADWGRRPLTRDQLTYAALDTHYLLPIYDALTAELGARGALDEARREFDRIAGAEPRERIFDLEGWRRMKGARELDEPGRAVLRALWIAREERGRARPTTRRSRAFRASPPRSSGAWARRSARRSRLRSRGHSPHLARLAPPDPPARSGAASSG